MATRTTSPAVREPLPQRPKKVPRYSSVTGGKLVSRPRWCWPFSVLSIDVPPRLLGSATVLAFGALLLLMRGFAGAV